MVYTIPVPQGVKYQYYVGRDKRGLLMRDIPPGKVEFRRFAYFEDNGRPYSVPGAENGGCCSWIVPTLGMDGVQ